MTTKYTPAPWSFVVTSKEDVGVILNANKDHVCDFGYAEPYDNWYGTAPKKEDLNLILAAPELLEACKIIVDAFDSLSQSSPARNEILHINVARAAITKALGETE